MNQLLLFHLIFLNIFFILTVRGCVTLENNDNKKCEFDNTSGRLQCRIKNPLFHIKQIKCSRKLTDITLTMENWDMFNTILIRNKKSILDIFNLYSNSTSESCTTFLRFIHLSPSNLTNIIMDKEFISNIPIFNLTCQQAINLKFEIDKLKNVNITVNKDIATLPNINEFFVMLNIMDTNFVCNILYSYPRWIFHSTNSTCNNSLTLISPSTYQPINTPQESTATQTTIEDKSIAAQATAIKDISTAATTTIIKDISTAATTTIIKDKTTTAQTTATIKHKTTATQTTTIKDNSIAAQTTATTAIVIKDKTTKYTWIFTSIFVIIFAIAIGSSFFHFL